MGSILGAIAAGLAIVAALLVGVVWSRGKYRQTSAAVWRENYEAEAASHSRLKEEVAELKTALAEQRACIVMLESKVATLTEIATGTRAIEELRLRMDYRFNELMHFLKEVV